MEASESRSDRDRWPRHDPLDENRPNRKPLTCGNRRRPRVGRRWRRRGGGRRSREPGPVREEPRAATELLPGFAGAVFERDAMGLAWLTSAGGIGAMLGALFAVRRSAPERMPRRVIGSAVLLVAALTGFVATDIFAVALPCLAMSAFALAMGGVGIQTIVQYTVPEAFRGRVLGLYGLLWLGCPAIGLLAVGALADVWGFQAALASALLLPAAAWVWIAGRRRRIEAGLAPPP